MGLVIIASVDVRTEDSQVLSELGLKLRIG